MIEEIRSQKRKLLFFVDDNIVADKERAKELFRALIPLKIYWVSQGSLDMLDDDELMRIMVKSGCLGLVIGFESIKPESLDYMHKGVNKKFADDHYAEAVEKLRHYGLQTWAAFTIGHDTDTLESIEATYRFARKNKFTFAAYNIPIAIGKSKLVPSFLVLAGARLIKNLLLGNSIPEFFIAALILSFASLILVSGNPTTSKFGSPPVTSVSTSTKYPFNPSSAIELTIDNIITPFIFFLLFLYS